MPKDNGIYLIYWDNDQKACVIFGPFDNIKSANIHAGAVEWANDSNIELIRTIYGHDEAIDWCKKNRSRSDIDEMRADYGVDLAPNLENPA